MLCTFCEGSEYSPRPHGLHPHAQSPVTPLENCLTCGETIWHTCPDCHENGRTLKIAGHCNRCGQSIIYWVPCPTCHGVGKVYQPQHACQPQPALRLTPVSRGLDSAQTGPTV